MGKVRPKVKVQDREGGVEVIEVCIYHLDVVLALSKEGMVLIYPGRGLPRNPSQSQGQGGAGSDGAGLPPKPVSKPKSSLFKSDVVKQ